MKKISISRITTPYRAKLLLSVYRRWIKRNGKALDVGCGTGIITDILGKELRLEIMGCDIKKYLVNNIPFIKINGDKLPFPNHSYDFVFLNDVLHHIDKSKQRQIINEALRVGKNVFIFEYEPSIWGKILDIVINKFHYRDLPVPLAFRYYKEWIQLFKELSVKYDYVRLKRDFWYPFTHIAFRLQKNK